MKMNRTLLLGALFALAACQTTTPPEPTEVSNVATVTAQVVTVDKDARLITLRREDGILFDVYAGAEVRNFDQVEAGDTLRVNYEERLAASLRPAEEGPAPARAALAAARTEPGSKPGAGIGLTVSVRVKIESIDLEHDIVVFSLASGELVAHRLATDEGRTFVKGLKLGDTVQLDYTQALAIGIEEL
jgi:hypothetical protein